MDLPRPNAAAFVVYLRAPATIARLRDAGVTGPA